MITWIKNLIIKLFISALTKLPIGRGNNAWSVVKPKWNDPKMNILWAVWLFISSLRYLKTATLTFLTKYININSWWFRYLIWPIKIIWTPIAVIFRYLKIFRFIKYAFTMILIITTYLTSPADVWFLVSQLFMTTLAHIDVLTSLFTNKIETWLSSLFNKLNDVKPSIESVKKDLRDKEWLPQQQNKTSKDDGFSLRKLYSNKTDLEPEQTPFYKNPWIVGGIVLGTVLVIGGVYYYFFYNGSPPNGPQHNNINNTSGSNNVDTGCDPQDGPISRWATSRVKEKLDAIPDTLSQDNPHTVEQDSEHIAGPSTKPEIAVKPSQAMIDAANDPELVKNKWDYTSVYGQDFDPDEYDHYFRERENVTSSSSNKINPDVESNMWNTDSPQIVITEPDPSLQPDISNNKAPVQSESGWLTVKKSSWEARRRPLQSKYFKYKDRNPVKSSNNELKEGQSSTNIQDDSE